MKQQAQVLQAALVMMLTWLSSNPAAALSEPLTCEEETLTGHVVAVKKGRIHIDLGSEDGLEPGMHMAVIPKKAAVSHPKYGSAFLSGCSKDVTAVVTLDWVSKKESSGVIGRASAATKGDLVVLTSRPMTHDVRFPGFPHEYFNVWDMSLRFRFVPIGPDMSFPFDFSISYLPPVPIRLTYYVTPAVVATGSQASVSLGFMVSYSSRFFEIGLGVGGYMDNFFPTKRFAVTQYFRLGAEHGLRLKLYNTFVWDHGDLDQDETLEGRGLRWDSFSLEAVVPIYSRIALFLEAGRGGGNTNLDWVRVTSGVHIYIVGYGGPGTLVLPIGIGGGFYEAREEDCITDIWGGCRAIDSLGLIITTGLEARW